ncbi:MAG: ABC transporter substrate-binding protein [Oscillospiraceae bacterium]|jgi:peptide/nickel transport system substrate-binding protein|nr:ABC transporter substrate-binding protein [Oscillospiraceae bacterium]
MKKKLAKILAITLSLIMILTIIAACNGDANPDASPTPGGPNDPDTPASPGPGDPDGPRFPNVEVSGTLVVAYGAPATGEFIGGFGNSSYDLTIRTLLGGDVGTVYTSTDGELLINQTVVKTHNITEDAAGNKTHTFEIWDDMLWSDGTGITASDFVAEALWVHNPAWLDLGTSTTAYDSIIGRLAYRGGVPEMSTEPDDWDEEEDGEFVPEQIGWVIEPSDYFEGIRLLGDYEFSLTIDAEELPYFFELIYASSGPLPLHSWAPGVSVVTDENGSKFSADITDFAQTVADVERFAPTVVAGPYTFVSFENNIVTLKANPLFIGDSLGNKPSIEFIQQIEVNNDVIIDSLFAGELNLIPQEIDGNNINRVKAQDGFTASEYLRDGMGLINIEHDWGPMQDRNVRWAFAHLVDRMPIIDNVTVGYGATIDTEASPSQWMWQARSAEVIAAIRPIALNVEAAHDFLDESEWIFEADGETPFDRSQANEEGTYLRHNAAGQPLIIRNGAASQEVGDAIEIETVRNAALAGVEFTSEFLEWALVLQYAYRMPDTPVEDRIYHTFSMGTGFGVPFSPYWSWHSDILGTWMNTSFSDAELDRIIDAMDATEGGDFATYLEHWFDYVVRWNYILPALPLYNNIYASLHSENVLGVEHTTPFAAWNHTNVITRLSVID